MRNCRALSGKSWLAAYGARASLTTCSSHAAHCSSGVCCCSVFLKSCSKWCTIASSHRQTHDACSYDDTKQYRFYRVLHSIVQYCYGKSSVCDTEALWSHRLDIFKNNFTVSQLSADPNITDLLQEEHPEILTGIGVLDWIEQCFTSPPTQYRLYGKWFLQVTRPNQQYQSTEGTNSTQTNQTYNSLVYNNMGWLGDGSHRGQGCLAWTAVGLPPRYPRPE